MAPYRVSGIVDRDWDPHSLFSKVFEEPLQAPESQSFLCSQVDALVKNTFPLCWEPYSFTIPILISSGSVVSFAHIIIFVRVFGTFFSAINSFSAVYMFMTFDPVEM